MGKHCNPSTQYCNNTRIDLINIHLSLDAHSNMYISRNQYQYGSNKKNEGQLFAIMLCMCIHILNLHVLTMEQVISYEEKTPSYLHKSRRYTFNKQVNNFKGFGYVVCIDGPLAVTSRIHIIKNDKRDKQLYTFTPRNRQDITLLLWIIIKSLWPSFRLENEIPLSFLMIVDRILPLKHSLRTGRKKRLFNVSIANCDILRICHFLDQARLD